MSKLAIALLFVCSVLSLALIFVGGSFLGFWQYSFFAPKVAQVQTDVFRNSQAYQEGYQRDMDNLSVALANAKTPEQRASIEDAIRHRKQGYLERSR